MSIPTKTTLIALLGLPRSGTTLLASHIVAHSRIAAIIEPFQAHRQSDYSQTNLQQLCTDFTIRIPENGGILLKETATRPINFDLTLQTLGIAAEAGHPTGIILLLRSPIESFYSQIEASQDYWKGGSPALKTERGLQNFWNKMEGSFSLVHKEIYRFPFRIAFFHHFLNNPRYELSRLMAFFPFDLEETQFDIKNALKKIIDRGGSTTEGLAMSYGDPKTWDAKKSVSPSSVTDRSEKIGEFKTLFSKHPAGRQMLQVHDYITELQKTHIFDDDEIVSRFFLQFRKISNSISKPTN